MCRSRTSRWTWWCCLLSLWCSEQACRLVHSFFCAKGSHLSSSCLFEFEGSLQKPLERHVLTFSVVTLRWICFILISLSIRYFSHHCCDRGWLYLWDQPSHFWLFGKNGSHSSFCLITGLLVRAQTLGLLHSIWCTLAGWSQHNKPLWTLEARVAFCFL